MPCSPCRAARSRHVRRKPPAPAGPRPCRPAPPFSLSSASASVNLQTGAPRGKRVKAERQEMAPSESRAETTLHEIFGQSLEKDVIRAVLAEAKHDADVAAARLGEMLSASPVDVTDRSSVPAATPSRATTRASARASTPRTEGKTRAKAPKRILVIGEVGDGKSTLINALRDPLKSGRPRPERRPVG